MAMICPRCNGTFDQRWTCPACHVRLAFQTASPRTAATAEEASSQWQQTPWGRILIGVLVAQGLSFGLRQLCTAGILATGETTAQNIWATLMGLLVLQGIQILCLLVAGLFAGAGQRQGLIYGAVVGVWNGVLVVAFQSFLESPTTVTLLGQPILHTAFGALGGFLGSRIWRAPPLIALPAGPGVPMPLKPAGGRSRLSQFAGPIAWPRVIMGTALALGGTVWANVILELVLEASEGQLAIDSHLQAQLVTWEVTALAMLGGAALAGACTVNCLKQGLVVGVAVSVILIVMRATLHASGLNDAVLTAISSLGLGLAGAWFGAGMFPPVIPLPRNKPFGTEAA